MRFSKKEIPQISTLWKISIKEINTYSLGELSE
jgi:hypothetical protein